MAPARDSKRMVTTQKRFSLEGGNGWMGGVMGQRMENESERITRRAERARVWRCSRGQSREIECANKGKRMDEGREDGLGAYSPMVEHAVQPGGPGQRGQSVTTVFTKVSHRVVT
jgi:hypothetical protein